ncbi:thiamine pyrophosphate-dependent enzyme [Methylorubrum thiocyanatum]
MSLEPQASGLQAFKPQDSGPSMTRYACMQRLAARLRDELVILSLGGSVDEWYDAAPHMRAASLFQQQLGCVTPQAFGLAAGLPHRRIVSLDTDGGLLFNLGILATLGNEQPTNLFVVVWDNQCYQSIGGPPTHTAKGRVDLAAIARGAGVAHAYTVHDLDGFERHCAEGLAAEAPYLVVAKVAGTVQPGIRRKHSDGREDKYIFVRHVEASEGVTIMGPSEHN